MAREGQRNYAFDKSVIFANSAEYPKRDGNPNTSCQSYEKWSRAEPRPVNRPRNPIYAVW